MKQYGTVKALVLLPVMVFTLVAMISVAYAGEKIVQLDIPDVCASVSVFIDTDIGGLSGVSKVETDLDAYTSTITFDDEKISLDRIKQAFEDMALSTTSMKIIK